MNNVVNLADVRARKVEQAARDIENRVKSVHSATMNAVIGSLAMYGIDARNLKSMAALSRTVHTMVDEHLAKDGKIAVRKDDSPTGAA